MPSSLRPVDNPLAWVQQDRLLLNDVSRYGLRRMVIARKGAWPDVEGWINSANRKADGAQIQAWLVDMENGYFHLWITWKEKG